MAVWSAGCFLGPAFLHQAPCSGWLSGVASLISPMPCGSRVDSTKGEHWQEIRRGGQEMTLGCLFPWIPHGRLLSWGEEGESPDSICAILLYSMPAKNVGLESDKS